MTSAQNFTFLLALPSGEIRRTVPITMVLLEPDGFLLWNMANTTLTGRTRDVDAI